ncbi:hypothetical protein QTO30_09410 [Yoonia sp. GPGPB17]|uniref:hypothetical protein n=1 Tax=Yoonia sp. GPGPB17 TaxID=3026147 RepID=UPI0030C18A3F
MPTFTISSLTPVLCLLCGILSGDDPSGPDLRFVQDGKPAAVEQAGTIAEVSLNAAPFTIEFDAEQFARNGIQLTAGRENVLLPLVEPCQVRIEGPFFTGGGGRYALGEGPATLLFLDAPSSSSGSVGFVGLQDDNVADPDDPQITVQGIIDLSNDRKEALVPGEDVLIIAYSMPSGGDSCSAPDDTPWGEALVDQRAMSFWRLKFE